MESIKTKVLEPDRPLLNSDLGFLTMRSLTHGFLTSFAELETSCYVRTSVTSLTHSR